MWYVVVWMCAGEPYEVAIKLHKRDRELKVKLPPAGRARVVNTDIVRLVREVHRESKLPHAPIDVFEALGGDIHTGQ